MTANLAVRGTETPVKLAKCVVWDLDDTLWHGTLADGDEVVPKQGVLDLMQTLDARGILMSAASKNNHDDALRKLTEFGFAEYLVYPQVTWNSKSSSISEIQQRLQISLDTMIFVDDQPFERDEVAFVHPEVETVDAATYLDLLSMPRLSPAVVSEDARRRRLMYLEDQVRVESERSYQGPREEFLHSLGMVFEISRAKEDDLQRLEELTRRTSQLNSTGIPYSLDQLEALAGDSGHDLWVCELTDRYGSYGKIGMALVATRADRWTLKLLLMSCRTLSKGVGTVLLSFIIRQAAERGTRLYADFRRTERNRQTLLTYQLANFVVVAKDGADYLYENDLSTRPEYPDHVEVHVHA